MRDAIENKHIGTLLETNRLVEALGIFLSLESDFGSLKIFLCCLDGMKHDQTAIALAPLGRDDTTNRDLGHVSACRTDTTERDNLAADSEPKMHRLLVVVVEVLIDTVLLDYEDIVTDTEQLVELVDSKRLEGLNVKLAVGHDQSTLYVKFFTVAPSEIMTEGRSAKKPL